MKSAISLPFEVVTIVSALLLSLLSIFTLYTTSDTSNFAFSFDNVVLRQAIFLLVGILILVFIARFDFTLTQSSLIHFVLMIVTVISLTGLFLLGPLVNQTRRWYVIGQFLLQPSEFVKYGTILWVGFFLTVKNIPNRQRILYTLGGILVPVILIFIEPDAGTSAILLLICLIMVAMWALKYKIGLKFVILGVVSLVCSIIAILVHPVFLAGILIALAVLSWKDLQFLKFGSASLVLCLALAGTFGAMWQYGIIKDYQKQRVLSFIGVEDETFQLRQAKIAIGSGGIFGRGLGQGTQSKLRFLPEYRTDFIFSAFTEERGFLGAMLLISLYLAMILRILYIAIRSKDEYAKLVSVGLGMKLAIEIVINIGMNVGLFPTKGVALPFMSYGGSSLLSNFILLGLVQLIYRYNQKSDTITLAHERMIPELDEKAIAEN